jgi:hypothetical protein
MAIQRFKGAVLSGRVEIHPSNAKFVEEAEDSRDDCLRRASIESMRRGELPQEEDLTPKDLSGVVLSKLWKAMGEAGFGVSAKAFAELTGRTPGVINSHHPRSLVKENKTYRALLVALIAMAPTEDRDWLEENISGIERR